MTGRPLKSALVLLGTAVVLASAAPACAQRSPTRHVEIATGEGKMVAGNLLLLGNGQLSIDDPHVPRLATRTLIRMTFDDRHVLDQRKNPALLLADGDRLAVTPVDTDEEQLTARWARFPSWPALKIPLDAVRGLILNPPEDERQAVRLVNLLASHRERNDLAALANGDSLVGQFAGLDDATISIEASTGVTRLERSVVRGLSFNPELVNVERLSGEGALISLIDGSRFRARNLKLALHERLGMRTLFGAELEIPLLAIESVRFLGGCATYLSELEPADYRFEPFFDTPWPLERDRTVQGGPLKLRGTHYPRGLGTHSQCEVTYHLDGKYRRFEATIGIDDDTLGKGSAVFEVHVDGRPAFTSDELTGKSPAARIDALDVSKAKVLTLRVRYGALADIQDHADWCDALLVK